ncbi:hypothetical protein [Spiroplasma endosymbiont of Polydrusus pterygomalis]|uniref:hypothetical protein n=1 Tax=Spiroplasma endosymbiont of Polydrusus pterygomalis TaxID=3139327 RepID=UPI003CCA9D6B
MKKIIKLTTIMTALSIVTVNSIMLFVPYNGGHYIYLNKHDANASLLKWNLSAVDANLVKKYEYQIHQSASKASIDEFNKLYDSNKNQVIWNNYDDLQYDLTHTKVGEKNIDVNWVAMYKKASLNNQQLQLAEQQQLRFYNIFAKVFGKSNVLKLIQKVMPVAVTDNTVAWTTFDPNVDSQCMGYGPDFVNINLIDQQYQVGFWSSDQIISVTTHEYGHALSNFIGLSAIERKTFNTNWNWSIANDNSSSTTSFLNKKSINNASKQINDRAWYLINYLASQTKVIDIKQKLLFALITVNSNYGRTAWMNNKYNMNLDDEFFAESFAKWILTPQNERDWGWELENSFFLHYLPAVL